MTLDALVLFSAETPTTTGLGYVMVLVGCSVCQAGLQGLLPDMVPFGRRGLASGLKGFLDPWARRSASWC